jgi:hypothetical protein
MVSLGRLACVSLLVNRTVPVYPVTVFPPESWAVAVAVKGLAATALVGAVRENLLMAPAAVVDTVAVVALTHWVPTWAVMVQL